MGAVDDFLRRAKGCGLVTADEATACLNAVPRAMTDDNVKQLAGEFVRRGLMTKYQATAVWQGKHDALILGDYQFQDVIGVGGMGTVFKAVHRPQQKTVAVKTLNPSAMKASDAVDRFRREAELIGKLNHRNIVAAFDAGEIRGQHYLAMEYVEGIDLEHWIKQKGPLTPEAAAACILQTARGLEYAHSRGVLHRDVKPANLLLSTKANPPVIKLLDLGLAWIRDTSTKTAGDPSGRLTQNDRIMGTVAYMAPEQALEIHSADQRADVYSLGCTFYFLVAGQVLYAAESVLKQLVAHREAAIPALPRAKPALHAVFAKMVAKQPEQRYASMTEVIAALEKCGITDAHTRGVHDKPAAAVEEDVIEEDVEVVEDVDFDTYADVSLTKNTSLGRNSRKSSKQKAKDKQRAAQAAQRRGLILGGSAIAIVALVGVLIWAFSGGRTSTPTDPVVAANEAVPVTPGALPTPSVTPPVTPTPRPDPPPVTEIVNPVGEYVGTIAGETWGLQVRPKDDLSYAIRLYPGGLPGEGWDLRTSYELTASQQDGRITLDKNPRLTGAFESDRLSGTNAVGDAYSAQRVTRRSVMLDKPPPMGAVVLFDGQSVEGWTNGRQTAGNTLAAGTTTKGVFRDCTLHLEYQWPADGKAASAPGSVLLQGRYEIVLANSFGQEATPTSAAAIKGHSAPLLNMSLPDTEWQTLDVAFVAPRFDDSGVKATNARCTVRHNGVIVHDNLELRLANVGQELPEPGPIALGPTAESGIVFRNIWLTESRPAGLLAGSRGSWPEPNPAAAKRIPAVAGLLHADFAFVQTLPYDDFRKFAESLQDSGYRPIRLRPYATAKSLQTAALWQRDGYEWQMTVGSPTELQQQSKQLQAEGYWPVDIAGYVTKTADEYVALWARLPENPATEARIDPGIRHLSLASTFGDYPNQGYAERVDQTFTLGRSQVMHSTLWWKSSTRTEGWFGDTNYYESHRKGFQIDLSITRGPLTGAPAYSWCSLVEPPPGVESTALHGLAPDTHLKKCAELVEQGYKPVAIGAAQVTGSLPVQTCSVWHRRTPPSPAASQNPQ